MAKQSLGKCLSVFGGHVSADLIFGAPGQTIQEWRQDLEFTIKQGVNHISTYQLTVEKGTQLAKDVSSGKVQLPSDNVMTEMYLDAVQHLEKNGLYRYEISNFGRPGFECNHNIGYWNGGQYIGLGPGAHSRIGCGANRIGTINHPSPEVWKGQVDRLGHGVAKETKLDIDTVLGELLATGLRTSQGIEASVWNKSSQNKIIFHQIIKYLNNINSRKVQCFTKSFFL